MNATLLYHWAYRPSYTRAGRPRKYPVVWDFMHAHLLTASKTLDTEVVCLNLSEMYIRTAYQRLLRQLRRGARRKLSTTLGQVTLEIAEREKRPVLLVIAP